MTPYHIYYQDPSPEAIEAALAHLAIQIKAAFADVTLGDGIGYYEADSIDGYAQPHEEKYQQAVAKDRTTSWFDLSEQLQKGYCGIATNFMDVAGLHYFLPVSLLCPAADDYGPDAYFEPWGQERSLAVLARFTPAQWEALLDFYVFHVDYEGWLAFWRTPDPGSPGEPCPSCGQIHAHSQREARAALTQAEAQAKVDQLPECQIWRQLQAAYLQSHPEPARAYLGSPRAESRQHLFDA